MPCDKSQRSVPDFDDTMLSFAAEATRDGRPEKRGAIHDGDPR